MMSGWTGTFLDVDLSTGRITIRETMPYARGYIGGRAMAARLAWELIPPGCHVFAEQNPIIITTGPLTGTLAPTSGRTVMGALSPRVYPQPWYTHSTIGGWFGPALKYAGFDAIVLHGKASSPVRLHIQDGQAKLVEAQELWGRGARDVQLTLKQSLGSQAQILAIGPAGENLVRFATVQHGEENAAGHSGFGAVWGSKKLKAISVIGNGGVTIGRGAALLEEVLRAGRFKIAPNSGALASQEARAEQRPVCSQACTFNCLVAMYGRSADGRRLVGHCVGATPWIGSTNMKDTRYSGGGIEVPVGKNFGKAAEGVLHEECNDLGLDLWFRLVMQPWLIGCRQLGIHSIRGYAIEPEERAWFEQFMRQLAWRKGLGALFAEDLRRAADELEQDLPAELIRLAHELEFGFGFPAHREGRFWDEEPLPFWVISAMMYASESRDPTIGSHNSALLLAEFMLSDGDLARRQFRPLSQAVWGFPDAFEPTFENKAPVAVWTQNQHMLIDSLPICDFAFPQVIRPFDSIHEWRSAEDVQGDLDLHRRLLCAVTGYDWRRDELDIIAERAFTLERLMLARAGRQRSMEEALAPHFKLPCRADGTSIDEAGFSHLLDEYYGARGWDLTLGWPTNETLQRVGLTDAVGELQNLRAAASSQG